jgi:phosphoesterase RecJ-like protein
VNETLNVEKKIVERLKISDNIHIITHKSPDPDTLGSALALYHALHSLGKQVKIIHDINFSSKYEFLFKDYSDPNFEGKLFVSVDVATPDLLPANSPEVDICIDHHINNKIEAELKLVRPEASATGEIIYDLITMLGININKNIANCLYAAIATDTGCFRQANTTANSHTIASKLMNIPGMDYLMITRKFFGFESLKDFKLKKLFFANAEFFHNKKLVTSTITGEMLKKLELGSEQIDNGLYSELIKIEGVCVSAVLRETDDFVKVSFRTNEQYNANEIAGIWNNGGGHKRAGGCIMKCSIEDAKQSIVNVLAGILL